MLDLGNSELSQSAFALSLSAALRYAGLEGQAKAFEQFVKSRQKDVRTVTASPSVSAYSSAGGLFGFEVGPKLVAIENAGANKDKSANILDRQSFPAVVIFGIEKEDLRPRIRVNNGVYRIVEPQINLDYSTRWLPLSGSGQRLTEGDMLAIGVALNKQVRAISREKENYLAIFEELRAHEPDPTISIAKLDSLRNALAGRREKFLVSFSTALSALKNAQTNYIVQAGKNQKAMENTLTILEQIRAAQLKPVTEGLPKGLSSLADKLSNAKVDFEKKKSENASTLKHSLDVLSAKLAVDKDAAPGKAKDLEEAYQKQVDAATKASKDQVNDWTKELDQLTTEVEKNTATLLEDYKAQIEKINKNIDTQEQALADQRVATLASAKTAFDERWVALRAAATNHVMGSLASMSGSQGIQDGAGVLKEVVKGRSDTLDYKLFGGNLSLYMPMDNVAAPSAPDTISAAKEVHPSALTLQRDSAAL